jgi:hypothetical protein
LGVVQVRNTEVQVELLGPGRIGPMRRPVICGSLEGKDKVRRRV